MARLVDTSPQAKFLRALQNQRWTVSGAISELVDNSFGDGRGDASTCWITWDATKRILDVLDDGKGMDSLSRLFRLGDTIGRTANDIGEYGAGGTMALLYLGHEVSVWTLRDRRVAADGVRWEKHVKSGIFPQIDDEWYRSDAANTPTDLLELGHGTKIRIQFPAKRHLNVSNVQRELARTYGPALRHGRRLIWRTVGRGSHGEERELFDLIDLPEPKQIVVDFPLDEETLTAVGEVGVVPGLTVSQSGIAICYGPRLLKLTRDCFKSPDGSEVFGGIGVSGYLDLSDEWRPYLSTTKSVVDDDRAWSMLMAGLFKFLRPMLEELERAHRRLLFQDLALELKDLFNGKILVKVEDGTLVPDPEGEEKIGRRRTGPETEHEPSAPASRMGEGGVELDLTDASDEELDGLLCRIDLMGKDTLVGFINIEHAFVISALRDNPPNRRALQKLVVDAIAARVIAEHPELIPKMFPARIVRRLEELSETSLRHGYLVRLLIDRIREDAA